MRTPLRVAAVALVALGAATQAGPGWCDAGLLGLLLLAATELPALWRRDTPSAVVAPLPAGAVGLLAVAAAAWAAAGWPSASLKELAQLAALLGIGIAVGRGLSTVERRLLVFALASVLGLSLLAFLVVDTAVGWRSRGRA